jgi:hypothetical protein
MYTTEEHLFDLLYIHMSIKSVGYVKWSKCISIRNGIHPAHLRLNALPQAICAP